MKTCQWESCFVCKEILLPLQLFSSSSWRGGVEAVVRDQYEMSDKKLYLFFSHISRDSSSTQLYTDAWKIAKPNFNAFHDKLCSFLSVVVGLFLSVTPFSFLPSLSFHLIFFQYCYQLLVRFSIMLSLLSFTPFSDCWLKDKENQWLGSYNLSVDLSIITWRRRGKKGQWNRYFVRK